MLIYTSYLYVQFLIRSTCFLIEIIMNRESSLIFIIINSISLAISVLLLVMETLKKQNIYTNNIGALILCVLNIEFIYKDIAQINTLQLGIFIVILITQFEDAQKWHKLMKHSILLYFFIRTLIQYKEQLHIIEWFVCFLWQPFNHCMLHQKKENDQTAFKKQIIDVTKSHIEQIPQVMKDLSEQDEQCSSILSSLKIQNNLRELKQIDLKNPFEQYKQSLMNSYSDKELGSQRSTTNLDIPQIWNLLPFGIGLMNNLFEMVINNQKLLQFLKVSDNDERSIILSLDSLLESCETWESKSIRQVGSNQSNRQSKRILKGRQLSIISKSLIEQSSINPEGGTNTNNNITYCQNTNNQIRDEVMTIKTRFKNLNLLFKKFAQKSPSMTNNADYSLQSIGQNIQIIKIIQEVGGTKCYLRIKVYEIEINNKINYLFLIENITNKEELRQLNIRYKYQQALLNSLCHELRTPMNSTLSQLNALSTLIQPNIRDKNLQPAIISAKKLMLLLNDILDYAQIDCKNFKLNKSHFDLNEIFEVLKELFEQECKEKQLDFQLNSNSNYIINNDKERILRILVNLIDNSIKFTNQGGLIIVNVNENQSCIIFTVEDNGVGMSEKILEQIRNNVDMQFYDSCLFQQTKLGLGLKISQQIAKYLCVNNKLIIDSTENVYTKIQFKIENHQNYTSQFKQPSIQGCNITISCNCIQILNVDDVRFNHSAIEALLQQHKVQMDSAYNGQQAIEKIKEKLNSPCCKTYKLIFMDIEMPVKNGYQASKDITEILKMKNLNEKCSIVMCSAYNGNENNNNMKNCGIKEILPKPIEQKQLKQLLDKYLL